MRVDLEAACQANGAEWRVTVRIAGEDVDALPPRSVRRLFAGAERNSAFLLPPLEEVERLRAEDLHYELCRTDDGQKITELRGELLSRQARADGVATFGRYLFQCLFGDPPEQWKALRDRAGDEAIELSLKWDDGPALGWELTRLPWEMMRGPEGFLASENHPRFAVVRRVAGASQRPATGVLNLSPRVLFVVGGEANDDAIRPGAEYIGLARRLDVEGLSLHSHLLLNPDTEALERAIVRFRPSIVHFICHGGMNNGRGFLQLADREGRRTQYVAENLLPILDRDEIAVVVLNACESAALPRGDEMGPLAMELVRGGVPVVVGMAGRVADRACRLFTWRFYESLLRGKSVAVAAAEGRSAAVVGAGDPQLSSDWALPTLYEAAWIEQQPTMVDRERFAGMERVAQKFGTGNPRTFLDRHDIIDSYLQLCPNGDSNLPLQVIAVAQEAGPGKQFGKSRLLKELAARAVRDGDLPCLVTLSATADAPKTTMELAVGIVQAIDTTRELFGLHDCDYYEYDRLVDRIEGRDSASLHPRVEKAILRRQRESPDLAVPDVVGAALRIDLLALRESREALKEARVVLLLDDADRLGPSIGLLLNAILRGGGLEPGADAVRIIFTYWRYPAEQDRVAAVATLGAFTESHYNSQIIKLQPFGRGDVLVYQQFLMMVRPPLAVMRTAQEATVRRMFETMYDHTDGLPSSLRLNGDKPESLYLEALLDAMVISDVIHEADDDAILRALEP